MSPPREGSGLHGGFDLTSGQIPPDGGRILCSNPPVNRGFLSPKQLHTSKQVIKESLLRKARFKSPSMGPTFQVKLDQIPPYVPGGRGVVGQHIDRCITTVKTLFKSTLLRFAKVRF